MGGFAYISYTDIWVVACLFCSFFCLCRRKVKTVIPTIAATARTEPTTIPAIAPPLIDPEEDGEGVAAAAVTVAC